MDDDLRRLQRKLTQTGQDFRVLPGEVARKTQDFIEQELCRQRIIRSHFIATCDHEEMELRDKLISELQDIVNDWKTSE